ncbi:hypothetical protein Clim_2463 [Chlorobium limicola DSM 245]|jgi:hypothetical protein|uniref:DUF2971 domain-containing protein n=1 Tax=Chlorobium limicola (strain DSM 245 / NBRC 103803 / 6330) TaxID=290315 RepID=B3EIH1_CHLL2|nr:DUF2971 domain-containing protein [Chlorobium limicola]ACD91483.1 hypothetical protein Clim_2463 [Chlorobium limicola DSM 245]
MKTLYYKYRPLYQLRPDGTREQHPFTQSIFTKGEIYYSAPKDFNDPFDCNLRIHTDGSTDADWEAYFDKLVVQDPSKKDYILQAKAEQWWNTKPEITADFGLNQHRIHYAESSVFCFSKKSNSIPMFSYYADSHQGIAVEFSFSQRDVPCGIPCGEYPGKVVFRDVEYPPSFPELNFHKIYGSNQMVRSLLFTKHYEWAHEEEFRIFRRKVPASAVQFDKTIVTRVIFGCRTTSDDIDLVRSWLAGWPSDVVLSKAETATDQFNLRVIDFETVKAV